jgi:hypothetical protein
MNDRDRLLLALDLALRALVAKQTRRMPAERRRKLKADVRRITGVAARAARRRRLRIAAFVLEQRDRPCSDCGRSYGARSMEFDHVPERGAKRFTPAKARRIAEARREIAKCDVVCCGCHEKRELARGRTHADGYRPCPNALLPGGCRYVAPKEPDPLARAISEWADGVQRNGGF